MNQFRVYVRDKKTGKWADIDTLEYVEYEIRIGRHGAMVLCNYDPHDPRLRRGITMLSDIDPNNIPPGVTCIVAETVEYHGRCFVNGSIFKAEVVRQGKFVEVIATVSHHLLSWLVSIPDDTLTLAESDTLLTDILGHVLTHRINEKGVVVPNGAEAFEDPDKPATSIFIDDMVE